MPRTYKKKKPPPSYSLEDLKEAVKMVTEKKMSQREAAKKYNIPKSVIQLRASGKISTEKQGAGHPTTLTKKEESELVECLLARAKFGYPCDRKELLHLVGVYVKENSIKNVFNDGVPGEDWYLGFMKRNPRLSLKKPEHLQKLRQLNTLPEIVYDFYGKLEAVYTEKDLLSLDKACFVFNTDESGFSHDPSRVRGIGEKGKALFRVSGGSGRESTTVLGCASADGKTLPPFIVFRGAAVQPRWISDKAYPNTTYAVSTGGWMEGPLFVNWFETVFIPHIKDLRNTNELPDQEAVLIFDGHASHITLKLCQLAIENSITLIRLPSHLTDKLQPLDKTVFGPVKTAWDIQLVEHGKTQMGRTHQRLSKKEFVEMLGEVWQTAMTPANIKKGFKSTGLFPVDAKQFPESKFNPVDLQNYKKKLEKERTQVEVANENVLRENDGMEGNQSVVEFEPLPGPSVSAVSVGMSTDFSPRISSQLRGVAEPEISPAPTTSHHVQIPSTSTPKATELAFNTSAQSVNSGKSIVEIFAETLKGSNRKSSEKSTQTPTKEKSKTRLKSERYGEVLTGKAVIERLEQAEAKKAEIEQMKQERKRIKLEKAKGGQIKKTKHILKQKQKQDKNKIEEKKANNKETVQNPQAKKRKVKRILEYSSSSDPDEIISETEMFDAPLSDLELEGPEEVDYLTPSEITIKPGCYVLVNVKGGYRQSTNYKYVCFVQSVQQTKECDDDDDVDFEGEKVLKIRVTGLRHVDKHATTFYLEEKDEFVVDKGQIIGVLPEPRMTEKDRKILYVFPGTVSVFEQS